MRNRKHIWFCLLKLSRYYHYYNWLLQLELLLWGSLVANYRKTHFLRPLFYCSCQTQTESDKKASSDASLVVWLPDVSLCVLTGKGHFELHQWLYLGRLLIKLPSYLTALVAWHWSHSSKTNFITQWINQMATLSLDPHKTSLETRWPWYARWPSESEGENNDGRPFTVKCFPLQLDFGYHLSEKTDYF